MYLLLVMKVDEKRELTLTNFSSFKKVDRVIETDHNPVILEVNLELEIFDFKNTEAQEISRYLTTKTKEFSECFQNDLPFEVQAIN